LIEVRRDLVDFTLRKVTAVIKLHGSAHSRCNIRNRFAPLNNAFVTTCAQAFHATAFGSIASSARVGFAMPAAWREYRSVTTGM
jgi:hypothetical protein